MNDQRALDDQLDDLEKICAERGLYDAQDWLKSTRSAQRSLVARLTGAEDVKITTPVVTRSRPKKAPKKTQEQLLEEWKRNALAVMDSYTDSFPLGHYFMWAIVNVGGRRNYRFCIGSGRSSRMEDARAAVAALEGCKHAWYNLD